MFLGDNYLRQSELTDAAELASELQVVPKPDLVDLIDLFIRRGVNVLKLQWNDYMGYK